MSGILRPGGPETSSEGRDASHGVMRADVRRAVLDVVDGRESVAGVRREPDEADIDAVAFFDAPEMMRTQGIAGGGITLLKTDSIGSLTVEADDPEATPTAVFRIVRPDGQVKERSVPIDGTTATLPIRAGDKTSAVFARLAA